MLLKSTFLPFKKVAQAVQIGGGVKYHLMAILMDKNIATDIIRAENYTLFRGKQEDLARIFIVLPKTLTSESKKPKKENPTKSPSVPPSSATWIHLVMVIF